MSETHNTPGVRTGQEHLAEVSAAHQFAVVPLKLAVGDIPLDWAPHSARSIPQQEWKHIPPAFSLQAARQFNAGTATLRGRWMVVLADSGGGVIRVHIPAHQWPTEPTALPPGSVPCESLQDAQRHAYAANATILETARVPRVWYIVAHVLPR